MNPILQLFLVMGLKVMKMVQLNIFNTKLINDERFYLCIISVKRRGNRDSNYYQLQTDQWLSEAGMIHNY